MSVLNESVGAAETHRTKMIYMTRRARERYSFGPAAVFSFSSKTQLTPEAVYFTRVIPSYTANIFVISLLATP